MVKVAILGGSGYTGLELLKLIYSHPHAEVIEFSSRQYDGVHITEVFPSLTGYYDTLKFKAPADISNTEADIIFACLPHGASMDIVPHFVERKKRIIDLSADYRLRDPLVYEQWYAEHKTKNLLVDAVYGLPELHRAEIKDASIIANPGCYPTSAILGLSPLMNKGNVIKTDSIIIDAKSGVSGAGRGAALESSFVEVYSGFKAYNVGEHRHTPEIEQELGLLASEDVAVTFTSHLLPVSRGILSTIYASIENSLSLSELHEIYNEFYADEPFVRVLPQGTFPDIKFVQNSNYCDIGLWVDERKNRVTIISAIDNLVKGASGQAVQNMNITCSFNESDGLMSLPTQI
ncbi:MAG: N-acetyl-gamma-glutamyl-phosphate reductase [Proteobacteria bacterium]|nr:N-acetyl-gamma-glutamyl-phosphate reductase [Pseudomonadota bacterium]